MKNTKKWNYIAVIFVLLLIAFLFIVRTGNSYMSTYTTIKTIIEDNYSSLPFDSHFKQLYFDYLRVTNRNHYNNVTFLTDGRLMTDNLNPTTFLEERTDAITQLNNYIKNNDTEFLFVRVPNKLQDNSVLPIPFSENSIIEESSKLIQMISDNGVDTLDLRAEMENDNINFQTAYYRYDIHWKAETALWAAGNIGNFINREYGFNIDETVWNPDLYDRITYNNAFQGNEIKFVNGYRTFEDITVLVPTFETDFMMRHRVFEGRIYGDFIDVFVPKVRNEHNERFYFTDYSIPEYNYSHIENLNAGNNKSALLIADSFGLSLSTFFSMGFEHIDFIYLITGHTEDILWNVIDDGNYDIVIFALSDAVVSLEDRPVFSEDRLYIGYPPE